MHPERGGNDRGTRAVEPNVARGRLQPGSQFWREIAIVLAAKAMALALIYVLFFAAPPPHADIGERFFNADAVK